MAVEAKETARQESLVSEELQHMVRGEAVVGLRELIWRRFSRHRLALVSIAIMFVLALSAIFAPLLSRPNDPYTADLQNLRAPPSSEHILGTDRSGRDMLARILHGGRVSLSVGLIATSIYISIGTILGGVSGYRGGVTDFIVMRITDIVMCFPSLLIILTLVAVIGPSIFNIMIILGLLGWPSIARLVRGEFLSLSERDFVMAARCLGATERGIIFRHILPNVVGPLVVAATFGIAGAIMAEAGLSFLGLGGAGAAAELGSDAERGDVADDAGEKALDLDAAGRDDCHHCAEHQFYRRRFCVTRSTRARCWIRCR